MLPTGGGKSGWQRAIGITPWSIIFSYLIRAIFYAVTAIILAMMLFLFVVSQLETKYPFYFPFGAVYLVIGASNIIRMTAIVLSVSLVASFLPVRGMMRMKLWMLSGDNSSYPVNVILIVSIVEV